MKDDKATRTAGQELLGFDLTDPRLTDIRNFKIVIDSRAQIGMVAESDDRSPRYFILISLADFVRLMAADNMKYLSGLLFERLGADNFSRTISSEEARELYAALVERFKQEMIGG